MGKVRKKLKVHIKTKNDITRTLSVGARLKCADNTGARTLQILAVKGFKGTKRRSLSAGIGDMVICSVTEGSPDIKKTVVPAVVIRQRKEYRRPTGERIKFSDNAAVVMTPEGSLKGTEIRGPVAREAAQRWSSVSSAAKIVI